MSPGSLGDVRGPRNACKPSRCLNMRRVGGDGYSVAGDGDTDDAEDDDIFSCVLLVGSCPLTLSSGILDSKKCY